MSVERISHFQPERIARAESGGLHLFACKKSAPQENGLFRGKIKFISEFARVTGAAEQKIDAGDPDRRKMIISGKRIRRNPQPDKHIGGKRPLQVQLRRGGGFIRDSARFRQAFRQFGKIVFPPCGVHDDEKLVSGNPVDNQIIQHAAFFIQQEIVAADTGFLIRHGTRQGSVERLRASGTFHTELAHVTDVKKRHRFTGMLVFGKNSGGILHRHVPACKRHHFRAERGMFRRKRRLQQNFFGHTFLLTSYDGKHQSCVKRSGSTFRHSMTTSRASAAESRKEAASPNTTWRRMPKRPKSPSIFP